MNNISQIGSIIIKLRKEKGVTQEDVAKFVGVSAQAVSKWENGSVPDTELLPKIADYFDISIDSLFGREHTNKDISVAIYDHMAKYDCKSPLQFTEAFELCWALERSLFSYGHLGLTRAEIDVTKNRIAEYEARLEKNAQTYSQIHTF